MRIVFYFSFPFPRILTSLPTHYPVSFITSNPKLHPTLLFFFGFAPLSLTPKLISSRGHHSGTARLPNLLPPPSSPSFYPSIFHPSIFPPSDLISALPTGTTSPPTFINPPNAGNDGDLENHSHHHTLLLHFPIDFPLSTGVIRGLFS